MRLLIGYDGSKAASAVFDDLKLAGLPTDVDAVVLAVADTWQGPANTEDALKQASEGAAKIGSMFPGWKILADSSIGSPPKQILAAAERFCPDLIFIGQKSQSLSEHHIFLGPTSQTVLTEAKCSVRVARAKFTETNKKPLIVIGFDGSDASTHAVASVEARNWPDGTEVHLVLAVESNVLSSIGRFTPQMTDAAVEAKIVRQWGETLSAWSAARLTDAGLTVSVIVERGHGKDLIIEHAESCNADAIFVGPHCAGNSFERFLLGSVSAAVAARAHCSVEVVRTP